MGWKSTEEITREEAMKQVLCALASSELTDEELADVLEVLVGEKRGSNYQIVG